MLGALLEERMEQKPLNYIPVGHEKLRIFRISHCELDGFVILIILSLHHSL